MWMNMVAIEGDGEYLWRCWVIHGGQGSDDEVDTRMESREYVSEVRGVCSRSSTGKVMVIGEDKNREVVV